MTLLARLRELAHLPDDWDGMGASPPTPDAVCTALLVADAIPKDYPPSVGVANAGIQFEWSGSGWLCVEAEATGALTAQTATGERTGFWTPTPGRGDDYGYWLRYDLPRLIEGTAQPQAPGGPNGGGRT